MVKIINACIIVNLINKNGEIKKVLNWQKKDDLKI